MARITSKITSIEQSKSVSELAASLSTSDSPEPLALTDPVEDVIAEQPATPTPAIPEPEPEPPAPKFDPTPRPQTVSEPQQMTEPQHMAEPHNNVEPPHIVEPQNFGWIRTFNIIAIITWLVLSFLLCFSVLDLTKNAGSYSALQWAGVIGIVLGPILLIWVTSFCLKQLARLSAQAHSLSVIANNLTQPDQTVIRRSKSIAGAINKQVNEVTERLNAALGRLATMEDVLNVQTSSLAQSNIDATQTADYISTNLQAQNVALDKISSTFDERMLALSNMISDHTNKLAMATQTAEQKIKEARISVEGATSKINSASDIVRSNTVQAASTLSASHADITSLGNIIRERSVELDNVYKKHANDLTSMIEHLRDEQQNLGAVLEERLTKMRDLSLSAQASAESLIEASSAGKDTVEALAQSATLADTAVKARFAEMKDMVRYSNEHAQSISDKAAQRVKDSLELTRKEIGRIEDDMADLQNRISSANLKSLELIPDIEIPHETESLQKPKRKRTRLKLKPIQEDIPSIPSPRRDDPVPNEVDTTREAKKTSPRPAEPAPTPADNKILDYYVDENIDAQHETDEQANIIPEYIETDEKVQRTAPNDPEREPKQGFSIRSLFGNRRNADADASLSIVSKAPPIPLDLVEPIGSLVDTQVQDTQGNILLALGKLGLSPNAVVDDGCIIEAANSRASSGHESMSRIVAQRLDGPVKHLAKALSLDADLSQNAIQFASKFDQSVESLSGNREAIRTRLEDTNGRAYLLCDAALNFGRV